MNQQGPDGVVSRIGTRGNDHMEQNGTLHPWDSPIEGAVAAFYFGMQGGRLYENKMELS